MATRSLQITHLVHICGSQTFPLNSAALENFFSFWVTPQYDYDGAITKAALPDKKAQPLFSKNQMVANRQYLKQETEVKKQRERKKKRERLTYSKVRLISLLDLDRTPRS